MDCGARAAFACAALFYPCTAADDYNGRAVMARYSMSGARAVQRFWYGWKMWSFAFKATWHACADRAALRAAAERLEAVRREAARLA